MIVGNSLRPRCASRNSLLGLRSTLALGLAMLVAETAAAAPLTFTLFNPTSSNQSRLNMVASAKLSGGELTSAPQHAPGGLNGQGSLSTLYNDTASTVSELKTIVTQQGIIFPGNSTATALNTRGAFSDLQLRPNVGGTSGTAPGDYGVKFSSPQDVVIPPIDVSALNIPGLTTLNLGTLRSIDLNIALRDIVIDLTSGYIPLLPNGTYPQTFNSTALNVEINGTSDMLLSAFLVPPSAGDFLATGAALIALQQALAGQGINITVQAVLFPTAGYNVGFGWSTPLPATSAVNDDATQGSLEHIGSNLRLTVPVKFDVVPTTLPAPLDTLLTAQLGLSGKLIGQTPFVVVEVPEPSSVVLATLGAGGLAAVAIKRRRRAG